MYPRIKKILKFIVEDLFGRYESINTNALETMAEDTMQLINDKTDIITKATFIQNNNCCCIDILKNNWDAFDIYLMENHLYNKSDHILDGAFHYVVLSNKGFRVNNVLLISNLNYEDCEDTEDKHYTYEIRNITKFVKEKAAYTRNVINEFNNYIRKYGDSYGPPNNIGQHCFKNRKCSYWDNCTKSIPKRNVFDIVGMNYAEKIDYYNKGLISFTDLQHEQLEPSFLEQIDFELNTEKQKLIKMPLKCVKFPKISIKLY